MLTGDRVETGVSIAISSGLKNKSNDLFFITEGGTQNEIAKKLLDYRPKAPKTILIIDGKTLDIIFESDRLIQEFFTGAILAPCLCVCRCSPT